MGKEDGNNLMVPSPGSLHERSESLPIRTIGVGTKRQQRNDGLGLSLCASSKHHSLMQRAVGEVSRRGWVVIRGERARSKGRRRWRGLKQTRRRRQVARKFKGGQSKHGSVEAVGIRETMGGVEETQEEDNTHLLGQIEPKITIQPKNLINRRGSTTKKLPFHSRGGRV